MSKTPWTHWPQPDGTLHTKSSMAALALDAFRRLRADAKRSLPSDGSSGQYDAFTETMIAALTETT